LVDGIRYGNADAVLLASLLHYGEYTVDGLKDTMERCGIPVRRLAKNG
jgi:cyclase